MTVHPIVRMETLPNLMEAVRAIARRIHKVLSARWGWRVRQTPAIYVLITALWIVLTPQLFS
ncbi:MAG: hypothetical protein NPINA01_33500 [Nitrospinaceae bacterium]|nr:MAG: hypothetical protein NPINA01_33500 [Nitrospinaceae bacterium]